MGLILGEMEPNYDKWAVEGEHLKLIGFYRLVATRLTCKHVDGSPNMNYTRLLYVAFQYIVYTILCTMFISLTHLRLFVVKWSVVVCSIHYTAAIKQPF